MGNTLTEPALGDRNLPNSYVIPANLDLSLSQTELLMNLGIQQGVAFQIPIVGPDGDFHVDETENVNLQMSRIIHRSVFIYPKSIKFSEIGSALSAKFDLSFVYDCGSVAYLSLYFPVKTRFGYRNKYLASRKLGPFRVHVGSGQSFQLSHYGCELSGRDISRYFEEMDYGYHGDEYNASNKDFVVAVVVTSEPGSEEKGLIQVVDVDNADISFRSQSVNSENDDRYDESYVSSHSPQKSGKTKKYAKMKRSPQREQQRNGVDIEMTAPSNSDRNDASMESSKYSNENDTTNSNDDNNSNNNNSNTNNASSSKLFNLYKNTFKRVQSSSMTRLDDVESEYCLINISRMLQVSNTSVTVRLRNGMVYSLQDVFDDDRKNDMQMGPLGSDGSNGSNGGGNGHTAVLGSDTSNAQQQDKDNNNQQHTDTKSKTHNSVSSSHSNSNSNSNNKDSEIDKSESTPCVICLSEPKTVVLFPCRHLCLCSSCAMSLSRQIQTRSGRTETRNKCPMCRQGIIVMVDQ